MKTPKVKVLFPMLLVSFGAFAWAGLKSNPNPEMEVKTTETTTSVTYFPAGTTNFPKERADIRTDLANFEQGKAELYAWRQELKEDRKASKGMTQDIVMDKKEIKKSKADIKHAKAYLKADKKDLAGDYRVEVKQATKEKRETWSELCDAKAQLRKDMRQENASAVERDADIVAALIREHDAKEMAVADLKSDQKTEWFAVKEEVKDSKSNAEVTRVSYYSEK